MKIVSALLVTLALCTGAHAGLITDPLSVKASVRQVQAPLVNSDTAMARITDLIGTSPGGEPIHLADLMIIPAIFEALHASGPAADDLRGYMDWLILTGVVIGLDGDDGLDDFDGMDGSDDLYDGGGDDEVQGQAATQHSLGIILGGPGRDTASKPKGNGIILGGPGSDNLAPFDPSFSFGTTQMGFSSDSAEHNPNLADD